MNDAAVVTDSQLLADVLVNLDSASVVGFGSDSIVDLGSDSAVGSQLDSAAARTSARSGRGTRGRNRSEKSRQRLLRNFAAAQATASRATV
jgi:hypothetical protein